MKDVTKMREQRAELLEKMEVMANETLDATQTEEFNALEVEVSEKEKEIRMAKIANKREEGKLDFDFPVVETPEIEIENREYNEVFEGYLRGDISPKEFRTLSKGTAGEGGNTVPGEWHEEIIKKLAKYDKIRRHANVISVTGDRSIPLEDALPVASLITENSSYTSGDTMTWAKATMTPFKMGTMIKVPYELLEDTGYDLQGYITYAAAKSVGKLEEGYFISGTGSSQPQGFLVGGDTGVTAGDSIAFTAAEVLELIFSLGEEYAEDAIILMKRSTLSRVANLAHPNATADRLAVLNPVTGQYSIEGIPVVEVSQMPANTTGLKPIAILDPSYYMICDRIGFGLRRLEELYAANGQVGFQFTSRTDGQILIGESCKFIEMA